MTLGLDDFLRSVAFEENVPLTSSPAFLALIRALIFRLSLCDGKQASRGFLAADHPSSFS